ncbi:DUF3999 domain-containing protein [Cupriavidus yeoncheonensis]
MRRWIALAALVPALVPAPGHAERFPLTTEGSAAFYTVTLDAGVYARSRRAGLADLRVRNGSGEPVPYALDLPAADAAPSPVLQEVPWFPLPPLARRGTTPSLGVVIGPDGALRAASAAPSDVGADTWLVDLSRLRQPVSALVIGLGVGGAGGDFRGEVDVASSDDLRQWTPGGSAQLLRASRAGGVLSQDRIELGGLRARYVRLTWRDTAPAPGGVRAETTAVAEATAAAAFQWRAGLKAMQGGPGEYLFDAGGRFPAERVRIRLPQPNTVVTGTLRSRSDAGVPWSPVAEVRLYRLADPAASEPGREQLSAPLVIPRNTDPHWRLTLQNGQGGLGGMPELALGWRPATVTFVARGSPPFVLAVGEPLPRTGDAGPVARADLLVGAAPAIGTARIAGQVASPPVPADSDPGRRHMLVLWASLLVAVSLLGTMAWRLARAGRQ